MNSSGKPASTKERELFIQAMEQPTREERAAFLDRACGGNVALRRRLEALLGRFDQIGTFLENPVVSVEERARQEAVLSGQATCATVLVPIVEKAGDRIGRYKLLQQIGEGGCGVVYMAEQEEPIRRRVALKVIKLGMDTKSVIARFEVERQALALMDHASIAKILDAGATETGRPFFVMELVRGIKITEYCDQNNLSTRERLDLFVQVCHALQHAHQKGIIHRDIKPSNILVSLHDGVPVPVVIDFGIAKATEQKLTDKTLFTAFEQFIGTPAYTSPEQAEMSRLDIDTRSDIYSLGVLLYELLTGKTPFDAKTLLSSGLDEMRRIIREQEPVRPSTRLSSMLASELTATAQRRQADPPKLIHLLRGDLDWIVIKCLEKDRTRRYENANELAQDIDRHLKHEPVVARPTTTAYKVQKFIRRNRVMVAAAAVVTAVLVLGIMASTWQALRATRAEREESRQRQRAEAESGKAERARAAEEQQRLQAQRHLYAADMVLAQQAFAEGNLGHARKLISKYDPKEAGAPAVKTDGRSTPVSDLRGWEWRYLWQQTRSDELYTLGSHHDVQGVVEVVFASDGRRLASRSQVGQVILWDGEKKQSLAGWSDLTNGMSAIGFSKDDRTLAVANGSGKAVRFFEVTTGRETVGPLYFTAPVWQLAFCPDGKTLVVSTGQELVTIDGASRAERFRKRVPWGRAWSMTFSPDGNTLAMMTTSLASDAGEVGEVILWDVASQSQIAKFPGLGAYVARSLAFSPDGNLLAYAGMGSQRALIWDVRTKQIIKTLETTTHWIAGIAFSPDGETVAMVTDDQAITLFNRKSWQRVGRLKGHLDEVWCVAFSPDGKLLVTGSKDNTVRAWSAAPRAAAEDLLPLPPETDGVSLSADGKTLVTLTTNNSFSLWDIAAMRRTVTKPLPWTSFQHSWNIRGFAISAGGKLLVIPRTDGAISVWETDTLREAARLEGFMRPAEVVALPGDGRTLAAASGNAVKLWDLETSKLVASWSNLVSDVRSLFHSPEHKLLIVAYMNGQAEVMDLASHTHRRARLGHESYILAAAISPDGRTLATGAVDAKLKLWDIDHDKLIDTISGQRNAYQSVVFSPDSRRIAAGGVDGTIRIWDSETHQEVAVLRAHKEFVPSLAFLPDGTALVSANLDALQVWRAPALSKIESAEKLEALQRAERAREEGAITEWLVLAPISFLPGQTGPEALEAEQVAGERQLRPIGGWALSLGGRELRWREVRLQDSILDFNEVLGQQTEESVAYAVCYIQSETEREGLRLWVGSDDEAKVYLNGQEKYRCRGRRSLIAGQDKVEDVALSAGLNLLVFKVVNEDLNWAGSIRLTDRDGNPVKGIKVTLTP